MLWRAKQTNKQNPRLRNSVPFPVAFEPEFDAMASAGAGSGEIEAEEPQYFDVVKATVSPAVSLLTSPLHLAVAVAFRVDVRKAHWQIAWIADSTRKRYVRILGRTPIMDYKKGDSSFEFQV